MSNTNEYVIYYYYLETSKNEGTNSHLDRHQDRNETKVNENTPDQMAVVSFQASLTMPYKVKNKQTNKQKLGKKKLSTQLNNKCTHS